MWLIILIGVLAFVFYFLGIKPFKYWKDKGVPYIKPVPFIGNFASNLFRRKAFTTLLQDLYSTYPDKRYVGFYQFLTPVFMLRDPDLIKKVTVKDFDTFPEHRPFVPDDVDPLWSKNLFAIRGEDKWHDMRSTLSPSFTSSKMKMMYGLMQDCAKQLTTHFQNQGGTVTVEMKDTFTRFTNDVIATTAFGVTCNSLSDRENEFYMMGKDATNFSGVRSLKFFLSTISPKLMQLLNIGIFSASASKFFRSLIKETLKLRQEKGIVRPDMVHLLMEARKGRLKSEDYENGVIDSGFAVVQESNASAKIPKRQKALITDDDITAQALIFFIVGLKTASTFMCFTAYELAINPEIQQKLLVEIDQAYENCKGDLTYEALLGMKYLDMVVAESLRKWPPALSGGRNSVKPYTVEPELPGEQPIQLEAGTNIWLPIYAIQRDPKYYPNPETFDPERFSEENKHKVNPFTYLPFGAGPRSCIGSRFALLEGKLIIAELLNKFEIVPIAKTQIPLIMEKASFSPNPVNGFWLGLIPRSISP